MPLAQGRKLIEAGQSEMLQELESGAIDDGPAGLVQPALLLDHAPVDQGAQDAVGIDAAHRFNVGAGHRLAIGDDGQGFQRGRRQLAGELQAEKAPHIVGGLWRSDHLHLPPMALQPQSASIIFLAQGAESNLQLPRG